MEEAWRLLDSMTEGLIEPYRGWVRLVIAGTVAIAAICTIALPIFALARALGRGKARESETKIGQTDLVALADLKSDLLSLNKVRRRELFLVILFLMYAKGGLAKKIEQDVSVRTFVRRLCALEKILTGHPENLNEALWAAIPAVAQNIGMDASLFKYWSAMFGWLYQRTSAETVAMDHFILGFYLAYERRDAWESLSWLAKIAAENPSSHTKKVLETVASLEEGRGDVDGARSVAALVREA